MERADVLLLWLSTGTKGDFELNFDHLVRFFAIEAPKNVNLPLVNSPYYEVFLNWYRQLRERLKDGPTRGFAVTWTGRQRKLKSALLRA